MDHKDNYIFLTEAPVRRVILTMAVPTIISMLVTSIYNIVTTFYVGRLNNQATAAVGISFSLMSIIQAVGFMFGHGSGNYISRELGAKHHRNAECMASTGFVLSVGIGLLISVTGIMLLHEMAVLLGSTPTILPYTEKYLLFVFLGAPFMTGALTLNCQMRFQGNASYAMYGILAGAVLNIVLAPVLMFVFDMGILGAGISTFCGQACSFFLLYFMSRGDNNIRVHIRNVVPTRSMIREIIAGGTPSLTRQGMASISIAMLNVAAGAYGDAAIAAMSIVERITFFIFAVVIGLGQGFQPMCGFSYGAHLYKRVRQGYWFIVRLGMYFMLICTAIGFVFSNGLINIFRNDPEVIRIGSAALRWQLATLCLGPVVMYTNMLMQTIRRPWRANILASARSGLFFIPLILILPHCFGLLGVEMCQAWSDVFSFILAVIVAITGFRELKEMERGNCH